MENTEPLLVGNKIFRHVLDDTLTDYDLTKAREELGETPEVREKALRTLKQILAEERDLNPRTDDIYLLQFLRNRKFNIDKALKQIKDYYAFRKKNPSVYLVPSKIEKVLKSKFLTHLPYRDDEGRAIIFVQMGMWDLEAFSYMDILAAIQVVMEFLLVNPVTQINGIVFIWDLKGFTFSHLLQWISITRIKLLINVTQGRIPVRIKKSYSINMSRLTEIGYELFKPFLKEKIKQRVKLFGSNMNALHQYLHPAILPEECGGELLRFSFEDMTQRILEKEDDIKFDRQFGY